MQAEHICSDCGAKLSPDVQGGLCVRCLFTLGLKNEAGTEAAASVVPITDDSTPETLFERRWALTLMDHVMDRLRADYTATGKGELYAALQGHLTRAEKLVPYAEMGAGFGMSEGAVKAAMGQLRKRYRKLLRAEIATTVSGPEEVEDEIRHLRAVASR